jgi:hypothetical protein
LKQESIPERRKEEIDMSDVWDLVEEKANIGQELLGLMVVENVHIYTLSTTV